MTAEKKEWGLDTKALHAGYSPVPMDMTLFRSFKNCGLTPRPAFSI